MTSAIAERKAFSIEPITYPVLAEKIGELSDRYMPLKIAGVNDRKGEKAVHDARMDVKALRVNVEKRRKELKAASLEYGKQVDSAAKALTELLEPIESHLQGEEDRVNDERERNKREAEEARKAKVAQRFAALQAVAYTGNLMAVPDLSDEEFNQVLASATEVKAELDRQAEAERQRQAAEAERVRKLEEEAAAARAKSEAEAAEKRRQEEAALAAERERLAEIQRKQDAEAARIKAENDRIEAEKQRLVRESELARVREESAERARVETEARLKREAEEAKAAEAREAARLKAKADADEAARLKAEALKPQREKLHDIADAVNDLMDKVPDGPGHGEVYGVLAGALEAIREIANGPLDTQRETIKAGAA